MPTIKGLHVNSTAPFFAKKNGKDYYIEDFEILTTILSALMWRKCNGPIKLYTDDIGLEYYQTLGLTDLWDGGIDTETISNIPDSIDQNIFWAGAKLFALKNEGALVALIDTDLIVWTDLNEILSKEKFACLHREEFVECYLPLELLKRRKGYAPDPKWDWSVNPCNTAFAYFGDKELLEYYTTRSIDFMTDNKEMPCELVSQMVFAEQRVVAMCAKALDIPIYAFLNDPYQDNNDIFSHLWGAKNIARDRRSQRVALCCALMKKINNLFPEYKNDSEVFNVIMENYF